ncbi:uncharacterized protein LOC117639909 isoform X1 [Thrips palmi]|uniref:Uncharacterized protein LOC117639909 isoform X1 n=1 Tax=Thrips palmi TaxID=161013 RepID=A0A6P8Y724_THRPL|nr:uncharacterized protein LOC117639909 isoform X1 [Thrips palmi]XP_034231826.1 uncharacterized protein LOC117639909 isoform X1 [Thrips palmi]
MDESLLLALPEDVLLAVLAHLSARELFGCRVLCRRLRDVCLHPALWRRLSLPAACHKGVVRAALRLAPCLLRVQWTGADLDTFASMVSETSCVVEKLFAIVHSPNDVPLATSIVQKLSGLGGLKTLRLVLNGIAADTLLPLLGTVYTVNDLRVLHIWIDSDPPVTLSSSWCDTGRNPTLRELMYSAPTVDSFLEVLLVTHAATLEKVILSKVGSVPVHLLNVMPRLRSLSCPPNEALVQLAVPTLREVTFRAMHMKAYPAGALAFLEASQLGDVTLFLSKESPAAPVQALARSRSAHLVRKLNLRWTPHVLDLVAPSLPCFVALQDLTVDSEPTNGFLQAVTPASLPCLTKLVVNCFGPCTHAWLHDPATQDVLIRNPRLHLRLSDVAVVPTLDVCTCPWCRWGCHSQLWTTRHGLGSAFSSHSREPGCPADCYQVAVAPCQGCGTLPEQ